MAVETFNDVMESIADQLGIYGDERRDYIIELESRIRRGMIIDAALEQDRRNQLIDDSDDSDIVKQLMKQGR